MNIMFWMYNYLPAGNGSATGNNTLPEKGMRVIGDIYSGSEDISTAAIQ